MRSKPGASTQLCRLRVGDSEIPYAPKVKTLRTNTPLSIICIGLLAVIGILFWTSMTVQAFTTGATNKWTVLALAIVLGGAHGAALVWTRRHSRRAHLALWFIIIGDSLLTAFVAWQAILLVAFTIVMLALTRTRSAKTWYDRP